MRTRTALVVVVSLALGGLVCAQQDRSKRPSPPGTAQFTFTDGRKITVDYSRPKIRDPKTGQPRTIMGGLVPYGQVWRTGANEATSFVTEASLDVGGTHVPAGKYTLYTLPSEGTWKLIISKKTGQWGIPYPGEAEDLARIDMKKAATKDTVQQFTISFDKEGGNAGALAMEWENTRVWVDFKKGK
jgi:hypothetical protein